VLEPYRRSSVKSLLRGWWVALAFATAACGDAGGTGPNVAPGPSELQRLDTVRIAATDDRSGVPPPPPRPHSDPPTGGCLEFDLNDYDVFLLGDYTGGTDVRGKVAAGGDIRMRHFSVGAGLDASDLHNVLVAGGNLSLQHGGIFGNTSYGGTAAVDGTVTLYRGALAQGAPINFLTEGAALRELSAVFTVFPPVGQPRIESWGGLFLEGTRQGLNFFYLDASVFETTRYLSIRAPAQSMVVVNVSGWAAVLTGFSTDFSGGIDARGVLFNFVDAGSITISNHGFFGTMLAPYAHISFNNGSFDGGIYAASMSGNAAGHLNPLREFDACPNGAD
jgi:choice-of-anchor A domain-containing protein